MAALIDEHDPVTGVHQSARDGAPVRHGSGPAVHEDDGRSIGRSTDPPVEHGTVVGSDRHGLTVGEAFGVAVARIVVAIPAGTESAQRKRSGGNAGDGTAGEQERTRAHRTSVAKGAGVRRIGGEACVPALGGPRTQLDIPLRCLGVPDSDDLLAPITVDCPRCGRSVEQAFYGPCDDCLGALRQQYQAEARDVSVAEYEPKMNVTPNAVALKDD